MKKTSSENEKETIISTPLEVIDAWEKLEYKIYGAKNSKVDPSLSCCFAIFEKGGVEKFLKTAKNAFDIDNQKGWRGYSFTFGTHNNVPIQNRGVEDQIWDDVANIFRKVLQPVVTIAMHVMRACLCGGIPPKIEHKEAS